MLSGLQIQPAIVFECGFGSYVDGLLTHIQSFTPGPGLAVRANIDLLRESLVALHNDPEKTSVDKKEWCRKHDIASRIQTCASDICHRSMDIGNIALSKQVQLQIDH